MAKLKKTLGSWQSDYIRSLMHALEGQSKLIICTWCMDYAREHMMPIYQLQYPTDTCLTDALDAAMAHVRGEERFTVAKQCILQAHAAARAAENHPAAQAAARAVGQAASAMHMPEHALGLAFYGTAAVAYHQIGVKGSAEEYEAIAREEVAKMERALLQVSVPNEANPAVLRWRG